jgi:hypothetical protein
VVTKHLKHRSQTAEAVFDLSALLQEDEERRLTASQLCGNIRKLRRECSQGGVILAN